MIGGSEDGGGGNLISKLEPKLQQLHSFVFEHTHGFKIYEYFELSRGLGAHAGGMLHSQDTETFPADLEGNDVVTIVSHIGELERE